MAQQHAPLTRTEIAVHAAVSVGIAALLIAVVLIASALIVHLIG